MITTGPGADTAEAAIEELRLLLEDGDFAGASALAVPNHAALASLAEGAAFSDVATALEQGDAPVAANFWSGFAQGIGQVLELEADVQSVGTTTESGVEFHLVSVTPVAGSPQMIVTQDVDGHRVDLFASFGAGLAGRMLSPVEILLTASTEDAAVILAELGEIVPSLTVAASDETLTPESVQEILQLIELITRVS